MIKIINLFTLIAPYRNIFLLLAETLVLLVVIMFAVNLFRKWKTESEESVVKGDKYRIGLDKVGVLGDIERQNVIRQILAMDGVDPSPNSYLCISDGGREIYARSSTISKFPKKVVYGSTLRELFSFPNCTNTVFVRPIDNETIGRKIDHQINILESEAIGSQGSTNRVRKLRGQERKITQWAEEVDNGNKRFFEAGFLFTFFANSLDELNDITDNFRALALNKKMNISNCFAVQSEAFIANLPLNRCGNTYFGKINSDCVKMHQVDQGALSIILNYTTDHFTHKKGIPLGRNLFSGQPFLFDQFDPSHFGYTLIMCGKTRSGKSATIKMMIERGVPLGYRYVVIDSQGRKGMSEGEYSSSAAINGGVSYQISSSNNNVLGFFDVQESIEYIKETADSGYERRTLKLNSAITSIVYNMRTLIRGNVEEVSGEKGINNRFDALMDSYINDIVTRITKELFAERGIVDGDADSLYEEGSIISDGMLKAGIVSKKRPTLSDFYKKLLEESWSNDDEDLTKVYNFLCSNLRENIRELYYTNSGKFFEKSEYEALPANPNKPTERLYNGEPVIVLKGIKPYYDGQSTFEISRDCPVTCIDISQLNEVERRSARSIAMHIVDSNFVQKNSERIEKASKLVVIVDEAHESFGDATARALLANEVRTAGKRFVGMIFSTQTVSEFLRHDETKDILEQAAAKMIFKQDVSDRAELAKTLKISESQADIIVDRLGVTVNKDESAENGRHKGEMCVIDGSQVVFVKVDYLRKTEALSVEADTSKVIKARYEG